VLQGGKHLIRLQLNARSYQYDGRTVSLADPPLRTDDGWYVPLPIAQAAWNGALRYDATKKTIQFTPKPAAHAVRRSASTVSR
jgi:hypothetical protein